MSRQLRRQQARNELKRSIKGMNAAETVGWRKVHDAKINPSKQPPIDKELASVFILTPVETRQDFELGIREFGEAIQASDKELPSPRIEYLAIFKPFPYDTNEEMNAVCETILKKYSPYNVYGLATGTPPPDHNPKDEQHVFAFAYHLAYMLREAYRDELQKELAQNKLRAYNRN